MNAIPIFSSSIVPLSTFRLDSTLIPEIDTILISFVILVGALVYFTPTLLGQYRSPSRANTVLLVNLFLGWTVIGWFVALVLALSAGQAKDGQAKVAGH